jgi:hypothetical protein
MALGQLLTKTAHLAQLKRGLDSAQLHEASLLSADADEPN